MGHREDDDCVDVKLEGTKWCEGVSADASIVSRTPRGNLRIRPWFATRASMIQNELYDQAESRLHVAQKRADGYFYVSIPIGFQPDTYRFRLN